jgi:hypothetical protein
MQYAPILSIALLLGSVGLNADPLILSIESTSTGSVVTGTVEIQGLQGNAPDGPTLGAFDFMVGYDPAVLGDPVVTFGDPVLGDQLALSVPSITCTGLDCGASATLPLEIAEISLDPDTVLNAGQASAFTLVSFSLNVLGAGDETLKLTDVTLSDEEGNLLVPDSIIGSTGSAMGSTPEPRTGILLPLAAALVGVFVRRRSIFAAA